MSTAFHHVDWRHHTNVYEVNLRQYTKEGTFKAFSKKVTRLKDMGVEVLWFMPITPISQDKRKGSLGSYYACSDYTAVNPEYGTLDDFKKLVDTIHKAGLKVIIDWVANHTGWDHVWTRSNPDFYHRDGFGNFYDKHGWDDVIDLNYDNPNMRHTMKEAMKYWVRECNIDGFRCDMAMLTPLYFWREARAEVDQLKPLFWLAELDQWDNPDYMEVFDACYTWKWMHVTKEFYQSQQRDIMALDSVLMHYESLHPKPAIRAWFTSNHDENSWNGTEYEKYGDMAKPLAVFGATWEGVPMIYSGQEMPNDKRLQFFDKDPIEWKGELKLHYFYKSLLNLHSTHPALRAADPHAKTFRIRTTADDKVFSYLRKNAEKEVLVLLHLSPQNHLNIEVKDDKIAGKYKELFSGVEMDFDTGRNLELKPWQYLVYVR